MNAHPHLAGPRRNAPLLCSWLALFLSPFLLLQGIRAAEIPRLSLVPEGKSYSLRWPTTPGGYFLEESRSLIANGPSWQPSALAVSRDPILEQWSARFDPFPGQTRFFRLRLGGLISVVDSSPGPRETGVSVTREVIFRFSGPIGATNVLSTNALRATLSGRRILTRTELSADRTSARLFYLEPLPGNTQVTVVLDGIFLTDNSGIAVDADGDGQPGGQRTLAYTTLNSAPVPNTAISGRVFASELVLGPNGQGVVHRPLEDVYISVDGSEGLFTFTDADGNFTLSPCPAGRFFVHVDGRTATGSAWPDGAYYPAVGKAWEAVAGRTDNLAGGTGEIYLPLIAEDALKPVSASEPTVVRLPDSVLAANPGLSGVHITIPANGLYADDGTRGGQVGLAPVSPERLPEPLPSGLDFSLVITIQTDGPTNFDGPVPARFPNLPNPSTGKRLPPGARSALWSFNHDTGRWEIQGPMTVSADGAFLDTDPGVGIRQPGWHGAAPGSNGEGGDETEDECDSPTPPPDCSECTSDADCDDGDPCTEDTCVNNTCQHTALPNAPCTGGPAQYSQTAPVIKRGPYTDSNAQPTDWRMGSRLCYDPASKTWRIVVLTIETDWEIQISDQFIEPTPVDGGNVTEANFCNAILTDLADYMQTGPGAYHSFDAALAHELFHYQTDAPAGVNKLLPAFEQDIQAMSRPCTLTASQAGAELQAEASARLQKLEADFWNDWVNSPHQPSPNDGAYVAGQKELNVLMDQIRAYAASKGWAPCNILNPPTRPQPPAGLLGIELVSMTATLAGSILEPGQTTQLAVQALYSDQHTESLPLSEFRLTSTSAEVASVSPEGLVTANAPGYFTLLAAPKGHDPKRFTAIAQGKVLSPEDPDNDGLPNWYEEAHSLNPNEASDARADQDGDGLTALEEFLTGLEPAAADSDGDGVDDGTERMSGTNGRSKRPSRLQTVTGTQYYLLYDVDNQRVVQRGQAGGSGVAHANLILAPNTRYRHFLCHAPNLRVAVQEYVSADNGLSRTLPAFTYRPSRPQDTDQDGLSDEVEYILGTDPTQSDTDQDGLDDGAELAQGLSPLDGRPTATGVLASTAAAGSAVHVCAEGNRVIVATGSAGIAVFNVFNPLAPTLISQLDTPGEAVAVACAGNLVVVADKAAGVALVDISDPSNARLVKQIPLAAPALAVAVSEDLAYVALGSAGVSVIDLTTQVEIHRLQGTGQADDIQLQGGTLFVLTASELQAYTDYYGGLRMLSSVLVPGSPSPLESGRKLSVCGPRAQVGTFTGWHQVDVSNPAQLRLLGSPQGTQAAVHDLVDNGNGLLVATTSFGGTRTLAVSIYDSSNPADTGRFLGSWDTPGACRGLILHRGIAYVADSSSGLAVVNFRAYDNQGRAPSVALAAPLPDDDENTPGIQMISGRAFGVRASATDDVQISRVELLRDGNLIAVDESCPFEFTLSSPVRSEVQTSFTLQLRAVDTGGNMGQGTVETIQLLPTSMGPQLLTASPARGENVSDATVLTLRFDRSLDPAAVDVSRISLIQLGPDDQPGGGDDVTTQLQSPTLSLRGTILTLRPATGLLSPGSWRLRLEPRAVGSLSGEPLSSAIDLRFTVVPHPATAEWISDEPGDWGDASRWSGGQVPGELDHVWIDRPGAPTGVLVSLTNRTIKVRSLRVRNPVRLDGVRLTLTGRHYSEMSGDVSATNSTFTAEGAEARVEIGGLTRAEDCSFVTLNGSTLQLPRLESMDGLAISDKFFTARGVGSRLEAPNLVNLKAPVARTIFFFFPVLRIEAEDGGVVSLPRVGPTLDGRLDVEALGSQSRVILSSVRSMDAPGLILHGLEAKGGGRIETPLLDTLKEANCFIDQADAIDLSSLVNATNVSFTVDLAATTIPALANVSGVGLHARSNASITLPALQVYPAGGGAAAWIASGMGASLVFPALHSLGGPTTLGGAPTLRLQALNGGSIRANEVTNLSAGRYALEATGTGSRIEFEKLTFMTGTGDAFRPSLRSEAGGEVSLPRLTRLNRIDVTHDGSASLSVAQWTEMTEGHFTAVAYAPDFRSLVEARGNGFSALQGAVIALPLIQSVGFDTQRDWTANGPGSRLSFGTLTNVTAPTPGQGRGLLTLKASGGGMIDLSELSEITRGRFAIRSDDPGSSVLLTRLHRFSPALTSTVQAQSNGLVRFSATELQLTRVDVTVTPTGVLETGPIRLFPTARLLGHGALTADLINEGEMKPGTPVGALEIRGNYTQLAGGRLTMERKR